VRIGGYRDSKWTRSVQVCLNDNLAGLKGSSSFKEFPLGGLFCKDESLSLTLSRFTTGENPQHVEKNHSYAK